MKKEGAIKILQKHLDEIDSLADMQSARIWKNKTLNSLGIFLGKKSELYVRFDNKIFLSKRVEKKTEKTDCPQKFIDDKPTEYIFDESKKENVKLFLKTCIESIKDHGIIAGDKKNFLEGFTNFKVFASLLPFLAVIGGACYTVGFLKGQIDQKNIDAKLFPSLLFPLDKSPDQKKDASNNQNGANNNIGRDVHDSSFNKLNNQYNVSQNSGVVGEHNTVNINRQIPPLTFYVKNGKSKYFLPLLKGKKIDSIAFGAMTLSPSDYFFSQQTLELSFNFESDYSAVDSLYVVISYH